jgi:hypothetical protein
MANIFDSLFACAIPEKSPSGKGVVTIVKLDEIEHLLK